MSQTPFIITTIKSFEPEDEGSTFVFKGKIFLNPEKPEAYCQEIYFAKSIDEIKYQNKYDVYKNFYKKVVTCEEASYMIVGYSIHNIEGLFRKNKLINLDRVTISLRNPSNLNISKSLFSQIKFKTGYNKIDNSELYNEIIKAKIYVPFSILFAPVIMTTENGVNYLLPDTEVSRYNFFKGNKIIKYIFNGTYKDYCEAIGLKKENGKISAHIKIKEGFSYNEKIILTKIVFQKEFENAVESINSSIAEQLINLEKPSDDDKNDESSNKIEPTGCYLKTKIPSKSSHKLHVSGKSFTYCGKIFFLVYQILSDDDKNSFDDIKIDELLGSDHRSSKNQKNLPAKEYNNGFYKVEPDPTKSIKISSGEFTKPQSIDTPLIWEDENDDDIFGTQEIKITKAPKEDQDATYSGSTKIIPFESNEFSTSDKSKKGSSVGKAIVEVKNITPPENILILERALIKLSNEIGYKISFLDTEMNIYKSFRPNCSLDEVPLVIANLIVDDESTGSKHNFYFVEFDNTKLDTRLALIYENNSKNEIDKFMIKNMAIFFRENYTMPSNNDLKNIHKDGLPVFNNYTLIRFNHTNAKEDAVKDKIKSRIELIIEKYNKTEKQKLT